MAELPDQAIPAGECAEAPELTEPEPEPFRATDETSCAPPVSEEPGTPVAPGQLPAPTGEGTAAAALAGRTEWLRSLEAPVKEFLRAETGGAAVLVAAAVVALIWANVGGASYVSAWGTRFSVSVGHYGIDQDLRRWVDDGLMAFFFLVMGLEARRELDLGELRDRRRLAFPIAAALGGMLVPVAIYLAVNSGHHTLGGWGTAMSTDTAFALGMLALVGRRFPSSLRTFMLTVSVADDLVAFVVIATAYTTTVKVVALLAAAAAFLVVVLLEWRRVGNGTVFAGLALVAWVALLKSGVDPVLVGVVMGLLAVAYPAGRADLQKASDLFRIFREQPTSEYARSVGRGVRGAISPNERLQQLYHPFSSYVVVPLFALANAGVSLQLHFLSVAFRSPVTLGILVGYVAGKPVGITGATWLVARLSRGRVSPPVGWASIAGGGAVAGIGFTVSLLIATLAFKGVQLEEAKVGVLSAALAASLVSWAVLQAVRVLPEGTRVRAVFGKARGLVDLVVPVDPGRDHIRGPEDAPVTLVEYGDFECPYCGQAEPIVRELLADFGDLRYVWRHLPLHDVHPHAQLAAEAAEAAGAQGRFWEMYDLLLAHQGSLEVADVLGYAEEVGLDVERFRGALRKQKFAARVAEDVESADLSGVSGTPTFFINGRRHYGVYDIATLSAEVRAARARATIASELPRFQQP
ncbi:MAG: Na+/H+ antiporter NhaA [Actinomycetota bacterium]|jgi:Na+/H+ antiporter NhaA|nr:Na+/H+ antiporter NhaA [Actinomycetota bacterium]